MENLSKEEKQKLLEIIKTIRDKTGCNLTESMQAFRQNNQDIEKTIVFLQKKGFKKIETESKERTISIGISKDKKTLVKVVFGCGTDFVSSMNEFKNIQNKYTDCIIENQDISEIINEKDILSRSTGEEIKILEEEKLSTDGIFAFYLHHNRKKCSYLEADLLSVEQELNEFLISALLHEESDIQALAKMDNLIGNKTLKEIIDSNKIKTVYNYIIK